MEGNNHSSRFKPYVSVKLKLKATRTNFHPRSQCNFQKLLRCHRVEKLQPAYTMRWQNLLTDKLPEYIEFAIFRQLFSSGGYFQIRRSGSLDVTSKFLGKIGARFGQVHKIKGKIWEVLSPQDAKVGKKSQFGVISEIQRAKFGVFVTYIFGGKIWGSNKNFRGKIWGQAPRPPNLEVPPGLFRRRCIASTRHATCAIFSSRRQGNNF